MVKLYLFQNSYVKINFYYFLKERKRRSRFQDLIKLSRKIR
jgi:hypothetical protein